MRPTLLPSLLLVLLTAFAFWPVRTATFLLYDDNIHVTENPYILPPTPARLAYFWRYPFDHSPVRGVPGSTRDIKAPYQQIYSPLAFTVWGLLVYPSRIAPLANSNDALSQNGQQAKFSLDPAIYHSFNLGLHVINVLLVFALLRQFVKQEWTAALGTVVFAVHPVQVEPVAWVTGMNNLLSGLFALASLVLYLKNKNEGEKPRWRESAYWGATFCFLLSILSKPSSVTLPALALLLCWGLGEKRWDVRLREMIPWLGIVIFCVTTNALVQKGINYDLKPMSWQKPFLIGDALTFYLSKLFFPWHLAPDYGRRPEWVMGQPLTYVIWLVPVGVSLLVWQWWRRSLKRGQESYMARISLVCLALFGMVLLPSSGLVTYYFHRVSTVSDRYMYMALLGPALLLSVMASLGFESKDQWTRRFLAVLSLAAVVTWIGLSFRQAKLWQSDSPLWAYNIRVNSMSTVAYNCYGLSLYHEGDYRSSITAFEKGLRVNPQDWLMELGLGNSYFRVEKYTDAELHYRRCLQISPDSVNARLNLGVLLGEQGKVSEAIDQFNLGLQIQPQNPLLLSYMGLNMIKVNRAAIGAKYLREALTCGFDPAKGHLYLGNALAREGKITEAMSEWNLSLQFDHNNYEAYFKLGVAAAKLGNTLLAIQCFENTIQLRPTYAPAQALLGIQWQKQGQKEKAEAAFRAALQIDPNNDLALRSLKTTK